MSLKSRTYLEYERCKNPCQDQGIKYRKNSTCLDKLVTMAIHGLSMDWKNWELVIVKPMKGAITIRNLKAGMQSLINSTSLVKHRAR